MLPLLLLFGGGSVGGSGRFRDTMPTSVASSRHAEV
jgi:hypothetical protein